MRFKNSPDRMVGAALGCCFGSGIFALGPPQEALEALSACNGPWGRYCLRAMGQHSGARPLLSMELDTIAKPWVWI